MSPDLWVLTTAPSHRVVEATNLFQSLDVPLDRRILVTNIPDVLEPTPEIPTVVVDYQEGINISRWWTLGLDEISRHYGPNEIWDVLVIETDARMSPQDVDKIRDYMRAYDCVMAGADWRSVLGEKDHHIRRDNSSWIPDPRYPDAGRVPGMGCVISGETGIRHDPEIRWWLADDDFEWQHRVAGGTILVGGTHLHHVGTQGPLTGERLVAWEEDQHKFMAKWGGMPGTGGILS